MDIILEKAKKRVGFIGRVWNEFKTFALRGNVIDLAVGIIIGAGFNSVVNSLVNDVVMPPIGNMVGKVDFKNLFVSLDGSYPSLEAAKAAGAATINYGAFLNVLISFLITAFAVFLLVRFINRLREKNDPSEAPKTRDCPFCYTKIAREATRCPACTSDLKMA